MTTALADPIDKALDRFGEAQETARRFHGETIGKDVDARFCFGDFLQAIRGNHRKRLETVYKTALSETAGGTTGGYLVPTELRQDIIADVAGESIFRKRATVVRMDSLTLDLPVMDATTAPSANGVAPFWGGLQMSFSTETATRAESEPKLRQLQLVANNLGGYAVVSNPMMADMVGTEKWLKTVFSRSLGWYEDWYFTNGTGVGQPTGIINAGCLITPTRSGSKAFAAADAQNMVAQLYAPNYANAVWLMSNTVVGKLTALTGWIPNGPMMLHGAPVHRTLVQPTLGTKGDVLLIDPSLYIIGDRQELTIAYSREVQTQFLNQQTVWFVQERIDGQPMLNAAITIGDGASPANTVSPAVGLTTL